MFIMMNNNNNNITNKYKTKTLKLVIFYKVCVLLKKIYLIWWLILYLDLGIHVLWFYNKIFINVNLTICIYNLKIENTKIFSICFKINN